MRKENCVIEKTNDPMVPRPFVVRESREETRDTFTLTLEPREANGAPAFEPGQFNMLYVFGVGEVPVSISGDPGRPEVLAHTVRAVGGVTRALQKCGPGDVVGVRGPFGSAWPVDKVKGKDVVIITGGIGLAPLRPAVYKILGQREGIGKFALLYGARPTRHPLPPGAGAVAFQTGPAGQGHRGQRAPRLVWHRRGRDNPDPQGAF